MPRPPRLDRPLPRFAARVPGYVLLSLIVVGATAGGLLAARGELASEAERDVVTGDVAESQLPTPVPLPSATPLPTPAPTQAPTPVPGAEQDSMVDTAMPFWVEWLPPDVRQAMEEVLIALAESAERASASSTDAAQPAEVPAADPVTTQAAPAPASTPTPATPTPAPTPAPTPEPVLETSVDPLPTVEPLPTLSSEPLLEPSLEPLPTLSSDPLLP